MSTVAIGMKAARLIYHKRSGSPQPRRTRRYGGTTSSMKSGALSMSSTQCAAPNPEGSAPSRDSRPVQFDWGETGVAHAAPSPGNGLPVRTWRKGTLQRGCGQHSGSEWNMACARRKGWNNAMDRPEACLFILSAQCSKAMGVLTRKHRVHHAAGLGEV